MSDVLDQAVLDVLRSLSAPDEPDVLTEVLQLFMVEVPPRLEKLRNAWAAGNIQEVHRSAHSLKGSAGNIGAIGSLVDALGVEYGRVQAEIERLLHT